MKVTPPADSRPTARYWVVIDLASSVAVEWLRLKGPVRELYDVLVLPGVRRPRLSCFKTDEVWPQMWVNSEGLERSR